MRRRAHEIIVSRIPRKYPASQTPLTILMPLAAKDVGQAGITIESLRRHVLHPIEAVVVVGQDSDVVRQFCADNKIDYRNEKEFLGDYLKYPIVQSHNWLKQQFIKLSAFEKLPTNILLVHDSDTVLLRHISFVEDGRQVFNLSDEYTKRYTSFLHEVLGDIQRHPRSFVAHSMLLQRSVMERLNAHVEKRRGKRLLDAIANYLNEENFRDMSEFELYGNYMCNFCPGEFATRYWYNCKTRDPITDRSLPILQRRYGRFNSVSRHIYVDDF